jgi:hypothetical protein
VCAGRSGRDIIRVVTHPVHALLTRTKWKNNDNISTLKFANMVMAVDLTASSSCDFESFSNVLFNNLDSF